METSNHLIDGRDRGYLADPLFSRLQNLTRAARKSTTNLMLAKKRDAERQTPSSPEPPLGASTLRNPREHSVSPGQHTI